MGIIESDNALARLIMQGETVIQAMRLALVGFHAFHYELDAIMSVRIDEERFTVQSQKGI
ncbi:hypothetical protein ACFHWW_24180 [Ensifer sp. P24N7]|uniref:hypothetical protein n=1 Tax=Sinorhizobium sp. P24N7 TaxID=3348358 RepID=UPI0035F45E5E